MGSDPPNFKQFEEFINHRCQMLEATGKSVNAAPRETSKQSQSNNKRSASCVATVKLKCAYCNGEHAIYYCNQFLALPVPQRAAEARKRKVCINCLRSSAHELNKCNSKGCRICKARHNTLLHPTDSTAENRSNSSTSSKESGSTSSQTAVATHAATNSNEEVTMLSTAIVDVVDRDGLPKSCRVLLDCGSQAHFISRNFATTLGLRPRSSNVSISGINGTTSKSTQMVEVKLQSRSTSYSVSLSCIITDQITNKLPTLTISRDAYKIPHNLRLADPQFNVSSKIDLLIGAEVFWDLLCVGQIKSSPAHPTLQKTQLGWILAGRLASSAKPTRDVQSFHATISNIQLHDQLNRFWHLEEVNNAIEYNQEKTYCERHFQTHVSRTPEGRYIVKLPVKDSVHKLGDSRTAALKRLQGIERRFARNPELKIQYTQFMSEYITLGHMKRIDVFPNEDTPSFYLPHHCVFKTAKQSSKIRVVFDGSCKSSTGISLNDVLRVGPVVQQDLMSIIMRFRTFAYVLVADVVKMYRQVLVHPSQTGLQRILWRSDSTVDVDTYELTTVTYGTSSASFLVTRCLNHLADRNSSTYPIGSACVKRDFYVDDLLTGANTLQEARIVRDEVTQLLKLGSFELSKWASNCPQLLELADNQDRRSIPIDDGTSIYILGIQWNQVTDTFHFSHVPDESHRVISKRTILSEVSRLFDPLGLLGSVIVTAKLILQDLWRSGIQWDESVPQGIHTRWSTYKTQLDELSQLEIPRFTNFNANRQAMQVHGFCDASQQAYGACVYIRAMLDDNSYRSTLLCSKSRIAPVKGISLPRLELSAALLLARLMERIRAAIDLTNIPTFLWSDSTITLNWIASSSRRWQVFVANRVGEIQRLTRPEDWRHVPTTKNPADMLSRGLGPREIISDTTWWNGPEFLQVSDDHWPSNDFLRSEDNLPELKRVHAVAAIIELNVINEILDRHSNLNKSCRIVAYCLRALKPHSRPPTLFVSHEEISSALQIMCKIVQQHCFPDDYKMLQRNGTISVSSKTLSLTPFLDKHGLIRVGGRLKNADLPFDACHPILLPRDHQLSRRIVMQQHVHNMHAGTQATMAAVRQHFWPLSLRSMTRKIILKCIKCFRVKPAHSEALMGSLPSSRVTISRPFSHCGIDYAGPLSLKEGKRRNAKYHKAYVAVFVCFAVKAVHLELVSDLTSDAFIAAFKRFISRRGKPTHVYSDNGTTFVGATNQLQEIFDFLNKDQTQNVISQFLRDQQTNWSFIPPNAPHCGGLWEAAVKSAKHHLYRVVGNAHLTFEEMQTVLCQIESILNSRPITALSTDANDLNYLSPGHFLIGTTVNDLPCHDLSDINENRLIRWQRIEQMRQHFWRRWSQEYLHSLQTRSKWKTNKGTQLKEGQLVLIKQQDSHPLHWLLGRVQETHVGTDGLIRTATVRTAKSSLTRPLSRLAILPIETPDPKC